MNKLSNAERAQVLRCLVDGNSIRGTVRITGVAKNTIVKLLAEIGAACQVYQDKVMRNLSCKTLQADEIWSFCGKKAANVPKEEEGILGIGDVWTWTCIDADTKLIPCWLVGHRDGDHAIEFMKNVASRMANRVQLTTDGHKPYLKAVPEAFGQNVDWGILWKVYGEPRYWEKRESSSDVRKIEKRPQIGAPEWEEISTSYVERANLTMRMGMRRFTRMTNGFSKKLENLEAAVSLHFMHYNFCRPHQSLGKKMTPAMAAGVSDHVWSLEEIAELLDRKSSH